MSLLQQCYALTCYTVTCSCTDVLYCLSNLVVELVVEWYFNVVAADHPSHTAADYQSVLSYTDSNHEHAHGLHAVRLLDDLIAARLQSVSHYESYQLRPIVDDVARKDLSSQHLERSCQVGVSTDEV